MAIGKLFLYGWSLDIPADLPLSFINQPLEAKQIGVENISYLSEETFATRLLLLLVR